ncbi:MAG TPA: AAA family ATPase [Herpetosiphonaceae bacterium]
MERARLQYVERICLLGAPGSGKSTLALVLAQALNLPLIRMSDLQQQMAAALGEHAAVGARVAYMERMLASQPWITDGYYQLSVDLRLRKADLVIFLDLPLHVCLRSVLKRGWNNLLGLHTTAYQSYRASLAARISYAFGPRIYKRVFEFQYRRRPALLEKLQALGQPEKVVTFQSRAAVNALISQISSAQTDTGRSGVSL